MLTNWGYEVDSLPALMRVQDFCALNPSLSSSYERIGAVLDSVSAAVRDWCGWHVSPSLECTFTGNGEGRLLMLPGMGVTAVSSLSVNGEETTAFVWTSAGMVRLTDGEFPREWRTVECTYTAGFDNSAIGAVVAQVAANMLVASPGVAEEHVGSAGITYNRTGNGITGGVSLLDRDLEILAPYRLVRAW